MARKRRSFTKEFKADAVKLVETSGRTVGRENRVLRMERIGSQHGRLGVTKAMAKISTTVVE